ncbi:MAG: hypothetical protein MHM6MM_008242, partial [Cercozoa sp. M6MM]
MLEIRLLGRSKTKTRSRSEPITAAQLRAFENRDVLAPNDDEPYAAMLRQQQTFRETAPPVPIAPAPTRIAKKRSKKAVLPLILDNSSPAKVDSKKLRDMFQTSSVSELSVFGHVHDHEMRGFDLAHQFELTNYKTTVSQHKESLYGAGAMLRSLAVDDAIRDLARVDELWNWLKYSCYNFGIVQPSPQTERIVYNEAVVEQLPKRFVRAFRAFFEKANDGIWIKESIVEDAIRTLDSQVFNGITPVRIESIANVFLGVWALPADEVRMRVEFLETALK